MDSAVENEKSTRKYKNHGEIIPSKQITVLAKNVTIAVLQTLVKAQLNFLLLEFSSTSLEAMWTSPISIKLWSIFLPARALDA